MISIGKIAGAVGLKGELKVTVSEDFEDHILKSSKKMKFFKENGEEIPMSFKRRQSKFLVCEIDGIKDRTQAEIFGKPRIYCQEEDLPKLDEDEFYNSDLIGLAVFEDDKNIGKIHNIDNFGAGDVVEIELQDGSFIMYPFTKAIFLQVEKDRVVIMSPGMV